MTSYLASSLKKQRMDWVLFGAVGVLLLAGTLAIMSATAAIPFQYKILRTHFIAIPLAYLMFLFGWSVNYQIYQDQWKVLYALVVAALIAVLFFGVVDKGSRSWFRLPLFSVQPSELCRIAIILVLACYLDKNSYRIREPFAMLGALGLIMPVFFLIMKQPDFSSMVVTFPAVVAMLYCAGASVFHLLAILGYGAVTALFPVLWTLIAVHPGWLESGWLAKGVASLAGFGLPTVYFCAGVIVAAYIAWWLSNKFKAYLPSLYFWGGALIIIAGFVSGTWVQGQMKEYQRKRFEVFLAPQADPKGAGYNILQAQIAMGSGGFWGKGVFAGTQSRLGFVPERHTDFILAVVGEELGFVGSAGVLGLYLLILWRILSAARLARDQYGYLVCCGIFSMFSIYLAINFGMSVGILPVAGIPLPMVSYGGSNMVATLWAMGLVESVYARRMALV